MANKLTNNFKLRVIDGKSTLIINGEKTRYSDAIKKSCDYCGKLVKRGRFCDRVCDRKFRNELKKIENNKRKLLPARGFKNKKVGHRCCATCQYYTRVNWLFAFCGRSWDIVFQSNDYKSVTSVCNGFVYFK